MQQPGHNWGMGRSWTIQPGRVPGRGRQRTKTFYSAPGYVDAIYRRNMADRRHQYDTTRANLLHEKGTIRRDFLTNQRKGREEYGNTVETTAADMGGAGFAGSGVSQQTLADLGSQYRSWVSDARAQRMGDLQKVRLGQQQNAAAMNAAYQAELGIAKERYRALHPNARVPKGKNVVLRQWWDKEAQKWRKYK